MCVPYCEVLGHIFDPHLSAGNVLLEERRGGGGKESFKPGVYNGSDVNVHSQVGSLA